MLPDGHDNLPFHRFQHQSYATDGRSLSYGRGRTGRVLHFGMSPVLSIYLSLSSITSPFMCHIDETLMLLVCFYKRLVSSIKAASTHLQSATHHLLLSLLSSVVMMSTPKAAPVPNVVVFGETGVGKSAVINLVLGKRVAKTSNGTRGCTFRSNSYDEKSIGPSFRVHDTAGLNEGSEGSMTSPDAMRTSIGSFRSLRMA
ncbi:hypothetical protein JAAARDRAFT_259608 [Jaapia argillacea MUCL 33604]|uniref:G domain-containing protein n=1 Tax=Jaapia argillacea MUCL 33604 TaxID=933084 RepID=A0A067PWD5_9AGAM|nr:hypothetical protein JAAARDRAFT_259608 [Jaapia argillacea MUCL 33604]